jgi:hypothetical protein
MCRVRHCYKVNCECNYDGVYCEAAEISIGSDGMCGAYTPKLETEEKPSGESEIYAQRES